MRYTLFWIAIITVACDHTTAPQHVKSTVPFALHLDSLATQACAAKTPFAGARCEVLRLAETAPAAGVAPGPTTVVYNGATQTWIGSVLDSNEVANGDSLLLNVYDVIAYSDSNLSIAYYARFQLSADDSTFAFSDILVYGDTNADGGYQGTGYVDKKWNVQTAGYTGSCTKVAGLSAEDSLFGGFPRCEAGTANVVLNGVSSFFVAQQTIPMVQIVKNFVVPRARASYSTGGSHSSIGLPSGS